MQNEPGHREARVLVGSGYCNFKYDDHNSGVKVSQTVVFGEPGEWSTQILAGPGTEGADARHRGGSRLVPARAKRRRDAAGNKGPRQTKPGFKNRIRRCGQIQSK